MLNATIPDTEVAGAIMRTEACALVAVMEKFTTGDFLDYGDVYRYRQGHIVVDSQMTRDLCACGGMSIMNVGFSPAKLIARFDLPRGDGKYNDLTLSACAENAIDALLEGTGLFYQQGNRFLNSGIFIPENNRLAERLLVINATFGRFLIGVADDFATCDWRGAYLFAPVAVARTLVRLFPADHAMKQSYEWLRRMHEVETNFSIIENVVDRIFDEHDSCLAEYWEYLGQRNRWLPFTF